MKNVFRLLVLLGLAACGHASQADQDAGLLLAEDFETLAYWLPAEQRATFTHEQAHSGNTALKVDDAHEYSLNYSQPLHLFQPARPARLRVSAWVLLPHEQARAVLVTSLDNPDSTSAKPLFWSGLDINKTTQPYGRWINVSQVVTLPAGRQPTHRLRLYLWHSQPGPAVYLDDLRVTQEP